MKLFLVSAALGLFATTSAIAADSNPANITPGIYTVEPAHTRVQFSVSHMGFTNWFGDFTGVSGSLKLDPKNIAVSVVDISIPVASISNTNAKIDAELKGSAWFDADTFPTIRFVSTKVVKTGTNKAAITGNLTFHGVTRPVILTTSFNGAGVNPLDKHYTVGFEATATINRSDFGVKTYIPLLSDETKLHISAAFEKNN
jgi:polyisoprenoid-binding protein YceI